MGPRRGAAPPPIPSPPSKGDPPGGASSWEHLRGTLSGVHLPVRSPPGKAACYRGGRGECIQPGEPPRRMGEGLQLGVSPRGYTLWGNPRGREGKGGGSAVPGPGPAPRSCANRAAPRGDRHPPPPPPPPSPGRPLPRCRRPGRPTCAQQRGRGEEEPQEAAADHVAAGLRVCRGHGRLPPTGRDGAGRGGRTVPPPPPPAPAPPGCTPPPQSPGGEGTRPASGGAPARRELWSPGDRRAPARPRRASSRRACALG